MFRKRIIKPSLCLFTACTISALTGCGQEQDEPVNNTIQVNQTDRASNPTGRRPNVLFIMSDDHRADFMGNAGDPFAITPNLDRLAAQGVRFTHFASQSPVCIPTRASVMTGMYSAAHKVQAYRPMNVDTTYLAEAFVVAGYSTGYAGKWHLNGSPQGTPKERSYVPSGSRAGFQEWDAYDTGQDHDQPTTFDESQDPPKLVEVDGYDWTPTYYTDVFLDFARRNSTDEQPWMYFLSYALPHQPEEAPEKYLNMFPPEKFDLFGMAPELKGNITAKKEEKFRKVLQTYYAQISFLDNEIGSVLDGLESMGLDQDTIVIYFSDHGQLLGSHFLKARAMTMGLGDPFRAKAAPYSAAFRAPLLMRWPGHIPKGTKVDALMSTIDLPSTILDLAGLNVPHKMQGRSMREWCLGNGGTKVDGLYLNIAGGQNEWDAVWTNKYLFSSTEDFELLYNHTNDPKELENLYGNPDYVAIQKELQAMLTDLSASAATIPGDIND